MKSAVPKSAGRLKLEFWGIGQTLVLAARFETESHLSIHRAYAVPVERYMAAYGINITPGALDGIRHLQSVPAGCGIEKIGGPHREFDRKCLAAPVINALLDRLLCVPKTLSA